MAANDNLDENLASIYKGCWHSNRSQPVSPLQPQKEGWTPSLIRPMSQSDADRMVRSGARDAGINTKLEITRFGPR